MRFLGDQDVYAPPALRALCYTVGLKGVVVAQGDSYEAVLSEVRSAIDFHLETFGPDVFKEGEQAEEIFVAEAGVTF